MEDKHTPGPWKANQGRDLAFRISTDKQVVATISSGPGKNAEANAHLIAAAPELLEALEHAEVALDAIRYSFSITKGRPRDAFEEGGIGRDSLEIARAVLAKAKGEG